MPQTRGGANCAVATCKHKYYVTKYSEEYIGYHRFPRNEQLRRIWVDRCGRKDSFNPNTSYICSVHFNLNDFEKNYMSQFGLAKKRDILKKDAIPTQKLRLNSLGYKAIKINSIEDLSPEKMGPRGGCQCSVGICKNRWSKTKNRVESPVSYHNFPKDPKLKEIWIQCCKREGNWNPSTSRICSDHFTADQFQDDIEARIMGLKRSKKLKPGAIPTIRLNLNNETLKNEHCNPRKKIKTEPVDEEYTIDSDDLAEANLLDSDEEAFDSPILSDQEVQIIKVINNKSMFNNKSDNGQNEREQGAINPLINDQDIPHSLKCPFLEENKCLKEEVKSLKMKINKYVKSIETLTKKNAALETALMKCLTLKASPPDIT